MITGFLFTLFVASIAGQGLKLREQLSKPPLSTINVQHWNAFLDYAEKFSKSYTSQEEAIQRFQNYHANMEHARKLQAVEKGTAIYGETKFSDEDREEFQRRFSLSSFANAQPNVDHLMDASEFVLEDALPTNYNAREHHLVTPVKEQQCNDCWAFSTSGNVEGQYAKKTGKLVVLSENQLIDCNDVNLCPCQPTAECHGGPDALVPVFKDLVRMGGLESEREYPYHHKDEKCKLNSTRFVAHVKDFKGLPSDEQKLAAYLYKHGPISVAIDDNRILPQVYTGGIVDSDDCLGNVNHAVLLVGFGEEMHGNKTIPFWILKNSWGAEVGEKGYFRLVRGKNMCRVADLPITAIVE